MKIDFVETERSERQFFASELQNQELRFVEKLEDVTPEAEAISVYIHFPIEVAFLEQHPALKFIATRSTGYDHIDIDECARRGILVSNVAGSDADTVAEHTFALLLALARRLWEVREANKRAQFRYEQLRAIDLKNKTLGVIGAGRIGQRVIHIAVAFGMKVLVCDPSRPAAITALPPIRFVSFKKLLRRSDVISLHAPLTKDTLHLIDREALRQCRPGVLIINTARGGLIDTRALADALEEGVVGGAGIDVLEDERVMQREQRLLITDQIIERLQQSTTTEERIKHPARIKELEEMMENNRLISLPNVIFTPHVAFNSVEAVTRINYMTVENIRAFSRGVPQNLVRCSVT